MDKALDSVAILANVRCDRPWVVTTVEPKYAGSNPARVAFDINPHAVDPVAKWIRHWFLRLGGRHDSQVLQVRILPGSLFHHHLYVLDPVAHCF